MNPWVALILGVLIGWLLEWLFETRLLRRRRRAGSPGEVSPATSRGGEPEAEPEPAGAARGERGVDLLRTGATEAEVDWPAVSAAVWEAAEGLEAGEPATAQVGAEVPPGESGLPEETVRILAAAPTGLHVAGAAPAPETVARCPQDLSRVRGIGSAWERRLYAAGIGTFWDLARTSVDELTRVLKPADFQAVNLEEVRADALQLAKETGTAGRSWDGTAPDDFEPLRGIGEVYEGRLYDAGICTYRALAGATVEELSEICKAPEWRRPDYASWIAQAGELLAKNG